MNVIIALPVVVKLSKTNKRAATRSKKIRNANLYANYRLRKCDKFFRRGNRNETVVQILDNSFFVLSFPSIKALARRRWRRGIYLDIGRTITRRQSATKRVPVGIRTSTYRDHQRTCANTWRRNGCEKLIFIEAESRIYSIGTRKVNIVTSNYANTHTLWRLVD